MAVRASGKQVATVLPARRQFAKPQMTTTQAGIATLGLGQLYISISDPEAETGDLLPVRLYWKPWVTLIWLGACLMTLGGFVSLADRRLRFGAPVRSRARADGAAAKTARG